MSTPLSFKQLMVWCYGLSLFRNFLKFLGISTNHQSSSFSLIFLLGFTFTLGLGFVVVVFLRCSHQKFPSHWFSKSACIPSPDKNIQPRYLSSWSFLRSSSFFSFFFFTRSSYSLGTRGLYSSVTPVNDGPASEAMAMNGVADGTDIGAAGRGAVRSIFEHK